MEGPASLEDTSTDEDFQKVLALIGGKERIYLVSDACPSPEDEAGILQEFIRDMFEDSLWNKPQQPQSCPTEDRCDPAEPPRVCNDIHLTVRTADVEPPATEGGGRTEPQRAGTEPQRAGTDPQRARTDPQGAGTDPQGAGTEPQRARTATRRTDVHSHRRTIDCPVIIFLFRQTFMSNRTCLKEVLKDVKARTKRATVRHPALIGLVGTAAESADTQRCAQTLEQLMRTVFCRHPAQSIWVSWFSPRTQGPVRSIKRNLCRVIYASQTADHTRDRGNLLLWPFQCLFWSHRGGPPRHANNSTTSWQRGDSQCTEEGIPLKTNSLSVGPHVDGESARKDN